MHGTPRKSQIVQQEEALLAGFVVGAVETSVRVGRDGERSGRRAAAGCLSADLVLGEKLGVS